MGGHCDKKGTGVSFAVTYPAAPGMHTCVIFAGDRRDHEFQKIFD